MHRTITILLAVLIDLLFGDPPNRFHPVVLMGNWLSKGRTVAPQQHRFWFGVGWITAGIALFTLPWPAIKKVSAQFLINKTLAIPHSSLLTSHSSPITPYFLLPILLKPIFAYRNLRRSVTQVADTLAQNDLPRARKLTSWHLVSRDTSNLTVNEVAGASIESLAENLTDSFTAPLLAYAIGGLPAAWGYRFINTADAMWGYRNDEFEQLGKFVARLDDILNWLPARLTGWLLVLAAKLTGDDTHRAKITMLTQHHRTHSPNAGWTMSAMAGALKVNLTKRDVYTLEGGSKQPAVTDIYRALRLADICVALSTGVILVISALSSTWCKKHT